MPSRSRHRTARPRPNRRTWASRLVSAAGLILLGAALALALRLVSHG